MEQKRINVCTVRGWILRKIAMMILSKHETIHDVVIGQPYCAFTDCVNLYCDVFNTYHDYKNEHGGTHIGFMTHNITMEPGFWDELDENTGWRSLDGIVVMGKRYEEIMRDQGYTGEILVSIPGNFAHVFFPSPIKLLMAQRGSAIHSGKDFLIDLIDTYPNTMQKFEFSILGDGWEEAIKVMEENGIIVETWKDSDQETFYPKAYQDWYNWCDYVFVPIMETAGPMCLPEALACGKPVICGDVGWAGYEFEPTHKFEPGNIDQCAGILRGIAKERDERRKQIDGEGIDYSWRIFATDVVNFIAKVDEKVKNQDG
jgi:glycosyltransferase involved in cell wall biosynthesis